MIPIYDHNKPVYIDKECDKHILIFLINGHFCISCIDKNDP